MVGSSAIAALLSACAALTSFESKLSGSDSDHSAVLTGSFASVFTHSGTRLDISPRASASVASNAAADIDPASIFEGETVRWDMSVSFEDSDTPDVASGKCGTVLSLTDSGKPMTQHHNPLMDQLENHKGKGLEIGIAALIEDDAANAGSRRLSAGNAKAIAVGSPQTNTLNSGRDKWYFDTSG